MDEILCKVYNLRLEIKEEIKCGNNRLTLQILDQNIFPPKISSKISCVSNNIECE